ncbi:hypothetical protein [Arthrobacter sp. NPDC056493]|uniref:hypothetical protein n=1 Tax=Arthrobacter sp. NPDC056493 TaxID=3345839 RepID=UPI00366B3745
MKKSDRIARELELSVSSAVENAKDRVEAAVDWAVPRLQHGIDTASPKIQEGLKVAAHNLADGVATVTPRLQDGLAQLAPKIHDVVEGATPYMHDALDRATPVIAQARDRVVVEYLPRLSDQIGTASEAVHRTLEGTPARVDAVAQKLGDVGIIHTIQEQAHVAGGHLKSAANEASRAVTGKALVVEPQKPKKRGLLILGVITAAVAAGVAAWKASKPVEDPWKTPAPVTPAPSTPVATTPAASATPVAESALSETPAPVPAATTSASLEDLASLEEDNAAASADKAKHVADDADSDAGQVATDEKTAVKNIASNIGNGADKKA